MDIWVAGDTEQVCNQQTVVCSPNECFCQREVYVPHISFSSLCPGSYLLAAGWPSLGCGWGCLAHSYCELKCLPFPSVHTRTYHRLGVSNSLPWISQKIGIRQMKIFFLTPKWIKQILFLKDKPRHFQSPWDLCLHQLHWQSFSLCSDLFLQEFIHPIACIVSVDTLRGIKRKLTWVRHILYARHCAEWRDHFESHLELASFILQLSVSTHSELGTEDARQTRSLPRGS